MRCFQGPMAVDRGKVSHTIIWVPEYHSSHHYHMLLHENSKKKKVEIHPPAFQSSIPLGSRGPYQAPNP